MKEFVKDELLVKPFESSKAMGSAAATDFAAAVKSLLKTKERIRIIFAAAPSQNDVLAAIVADQSIDFSRIDGFHMDEYIGLSANAPQGFGNFLHRSIFSLRDFHAVYYLDGQNPDSEAACESYAKLLGEAPIDIVCMGVGENGHIAFDDPSVADFNDSKDVKIVKLDEICRNQQVHDGCFKKLQDVPTHAMTLTVPMLMRAKYHFCVVPAKTKANAVRIMLTGEIGEYCPCTILRKAPGAILYLDKESSALLTECNQ
ncbi:MAG: 6-phosphogluconolactonase [Clostridia bacterium]